MLLTCNWPTLRLAPAVTVSGSMFKTFSTGFWLEVSCSWGVLGDNGGKGPFLGAVLWAEAMWRFRMGAHMASTMLAAPTKVILSVEYRMGGGRD